MFVYLDSLRNSFSIGALIGILFTRVENTNTVRRQMRIIKSSFEEKLTFYKAPRRSILFKTSISKRIKVAEAAEAGRDVYRYDSKVLAGQQYEKLTSEILERVH
jgi:cellulose biosynthesis protein BcsQ